MKFNVGDIVLIKDIHPHLLPHLLPRFHPRPPIELRLINTFGIITAFEKHSDLFKKGSTENDNGYIWYSQVNMKEYYFFGGEVDGEVVK